MISRINSHEICVLSDVEYVKEYEIISYYSYKYLSYFFKYFCIIL